MPDLADILATFRDTGYLIAPAGFGKTHLIAEAVSRGSNRQLVLTHTYAGVNVLRRKMGELRVSQHCFGLTPSLVLRCGSVSRTPRLPDGQANGQLATMVRAISACSVLLDSAFIRRIFRASYAGLYVDEYQDCSACSINLC